MRTPALISILERWWNGLAGAERIFYGIGMLAACVSASLVAVANFGPDHFGAFAALSGKVNSQPLASAGSFLVQPSMGLFLGFGGMGGVVLAQGVSLAIALLLAVMAGALLMAVMVLMLRTILAVCSDTSGRGENAEGGVRTLYLTLPALTPDAGGGAVNLRRRQKATQVFL